MKTIRRIAVAAVLIFVVPGLFAGALLAYMHAGDADSNVVGFAPSTFTAMAETPFFYSIGDDLKYSDHIDAAAPTLLRGHITSFRVAADGQSIAVKVNGRIVAVNREGRIVPMTSMNERDQSLVGGGDTTGTSHLLPPVGVSLDEQRSYTGLLEDRQQKQQWLVLHGKRALALSEGRSFEGAGFCSELGRSAFLPGDRYFLFDLPRCGNYKGQLLVDSQTLRYEELPPATRIYPVFAIRSYPHYWMTEGGVIPE